MNSPAAAARPPRFAVWLVAAFALDTQAEPVEGDLLEEFSAIASNANPSAARSWYWKQSLKTCALLAWTSLRTAPWLIACTSLGGFYLLWITRNLPTHFVCAAIDHDAGFYTNHFPAWQFCLNYGIPAVSMILTILVGYLIALVARGREIVATATFGAFRFLTAPVFATLLFLFIHEALPGHHLVVMLPDPDYIRVSLAFMYHGDLAALVLFCVSPFTTALLPTIGGMIVRKIRQSAARAPVFA
jgi:hypothetical protein